MATVKSMEKMIRSIDIRGGRFSAIAVLSTLLFSGGLAASEECGAGSVPANTDPKASAISGTISPSAASTTPADHIKAVIIHSYAGFYNNDDACFFMANALSTAGIDATVAAYHQLDTMDELLEYDVFIFGSCGHYFDDHISGYGTVQDEVRSFVEDHGRGVVGVGGANYTSAFNRYHDYDAVMPVHLHVPYGYLWGYEVGITDPSHPITHGVNGFQFDSSSLAEWCPGGTKSGSLVLAEYAQNSRETVVCWSTGPAEGRAAYLGPFYLADLDSFATELLYQNPDTVRLLVNAVRWSSGKAALDVDQLIPGQPTTLRVVNARPFDTVVFALSRRGGGPTPSPWGDLFLTPPIEALPYRTADANGMALFTSLCPNRTGMHFWFQAVDVEEGLLTNGWDGAIQ